MAFRLVLAPGELDRVRRRFLPDRDKLDAIGAIVSEQIDQRFETQGGSGGKPWASPKFVEAIGRPDGRKLLEGISKTLRASFERTSDDTTTEIASPHVAALVAQQGTVGKGGTLPDIRAKNARALFIPISDRAQMTRPVTPWGMRAKRQYDATLVKGSLVNGKLVPPDADFIYLSKVAQAERPMLPDSPREREAVADAVVKIMRDGSES
jgi:hypothetical protein